MNVNLRFLYEHYSIAYISQIVNDYMNQVIAEALAQADIIYWGKYVGSLGIEFPCWTDPRRVLRSPESLRVISREVARLIKNWNIDVIAGAATAGIPFATVVAQDAQLPFIYVSKEAKTYGNKSAIQGIINKGERVILIDDASGNGSTKRPFCEQLLNEGACLQHVLVLVGFGQQIIPWYAENSIEFHELVHFHELMDYLKDTGRLSVRLHSFVKDMYKVDEFKKIWDGAKWQEFLEVVKEEGIDYHL